MSNLQEIWKPVVGFEGLYEISNLGRVKSLPRTKLCGPGHKLMRTYKEVILQAKCVLGYYQVVLCKDGKTKQMKVHRLVARHFVDGYREDLQVNHIDGVKTNNVFSNLEWCDARHNVLHSIRTGLRKGKKYGNSHFARKVRNVRSGVVYDSIKRAAESTGISVTVLSTYLNNNPSPRSPRMLQRLSELVFENPQ